MYADDNYNSYSKIGKIMLIAGLVIAIIGYYIMKKPEKVELYRNKLRNAIRSLRNKFSKNNQ